MRELSFKENAVPLVTPVQFYSWKVSYGQHNGFN